MRLDKDNKAWQILTNDEKVGIKLNLGFQKSTWEAGEIMKKAHYKFLEIRSRAKHFLKIFTYHFENWGELVHEDVRISKDLKIYFELTILGRKKVSEAIRQIDNPLFHHTSHRSELITSEVLTWRRSSRIAEKQFHDLILEFDRWNNFRILPEGVQEPSAFKRRNKKRHFKHVMVAMELSDSAIHVIRKKMAPGKSSKALYVGCGNIGSGKAYCLPVANNPDVIKILTKASLYIFNNELDCNEYLKLTLEYAQKDTRHCKEGQVFWPQYRVLIKKAINYEQIQNITPTRRNPEIINEARDLKITRKIGL